jgi:putative phosphoesterase
VHAGDFVALSVLEELRARGPVEAVYGNMDEPRLRESLPKERVVEVESVRIGIVHIPGPRAGREARLAGRFPGCAAIVYGHTHIPQVERFGDVWILNPGSPTERRRGPVHSMLVLEVAGAVIRPQLVTLS